MATHEKISRRTWLKGMAVFSAAAGVPLVLSSTAAEAKASKAAVHYRDSPNGMQMCHMCKFYIGGRGGMMGGGMMRRGGMMGGAGACQVVEGRIGPMGWCDLYAPL
jgi:anaerobic selenocysteine-containing dehydrogenase